MSTLTAALALLIGLAGPHDAPPAPEARQHATARPLAARHVAEDWPRLFGPHGDATSRETPLDLDFDGAGPKLLWEVPTGSGYAAPAVVGDRLVLFDRIGDTERVACLSATTGESLWTYGYPSDYVDRFEFGNGPRAAPVIAGDRVFTHGAEGPLHCFDLATGRIVWQIDTARKYDIPQDFFGVGPTPLVHEDKLILALGAPNGPCLVALEAKTGREVWRAAAHNWRAGYASPALVTLHGEPRVVFLAGGDDDPPTGGLVVVDPDDGRVVLTHPFRSRKYLSVNASNPVVHDNAVFLSSSYGPDAVLLEITRDGAVRTRWQSEFGAHFMTPIYRDGHLYGITGAGKGDTALACLDWASGRTVWREAPRWPVQLEQRTVNRSSYLGSLLGLPDGFLLLGEEGHLARVALTPDGYREQSRVQLFFAPETWVPPVLSRGLLYICQNQPDHRDGRPPRLLCYDLRGG